MLENDRRGGWVASLSQFFGWLVTSLLAIVDMLAIREAFLALMAWFSVIETAAYRASGGSGQSLFTTFGITALDNVLLLIMGIGVIAVVVVIESYFRKGRPMGLLYKRIGKVLLIEIAIIIVGLLIRQGVSTILANTGA